jgi:hypothetical protein
MAAHRSDGFAGAIARVWGRGGVFGCQSSLYPFQCHRKDSSALTLCCEQFTKVSSHGYVFIGAFDNLKKKQL